MRNQIGVTPRSNLYISYSFKSDHGRFFTESRANIVIERLLVGRDKQPPTVSALEKKYHRWKK